MPHSLSKGEADGRQSPLDRVKRNLGYVDLFRVRPVIDMGIRWC
jgi:hypothetical protein